MRGGAYPATVEELEAAHALIAEYPAVYADKRSGAVYIPHRQDEEAAIAIVRAYPDAAYRLDLVATWADQKAVDKIPPAHDVRQLAFAPTYLPGIDTYWREHGYGPEWKP